MLLQLLSWALLAVAVCGTPLERVAARIYACSIRAWRHVELSAGLNHVLLVVLQATSLRARW